jgi:uncharacterized membrane protein
MTRPGVPVAVGALALAAWGVASEWNLYPHPRITDVPVYEELGRRVAGGDVAYRDFDFEYPPLAAALLALPRLLPLSYSTGFSLLMSLALIVTALGVVATAHALGMSRRRQLAAGGAVALVPLLLGDFVQTRFDLAVAAPVAWALWAAVTLRWRSAWTLLAAAVALKLAPFVLVPLLVIWHAHHRGATDVLRRGVAAAGAVVATYLPFVVLAPAGVWRLFSYHLERPLQIESAGSAYLLGLDVLADIPVRVESSFGSQNLAGQGPAVVATIGTVVGVIAVAAVCIAFAVLLARPRNDGARLFVSAAATALTVALVTAKVLSPQFLLWLVPAVFLVSGRYGRFAFATAIGALLATQLYFPVRYWDLVALETGPIVLLVIRDTLLVVLTAAAWPRQSEETATLNGVIAVARPSEPASTTAP